MSCPGYDALGVSAAIQNHPEGIPSGVTFVSTQTAASAPKGPRWAKALLTHINRPRGPSPRKAGWSGMLSMHFQAQQWGKKKSKWCLPDSRKRAKLQLCSCLPSRMENPGCIPMGSHCYGGLQGVFSAHGRITLQTHLAGATENPRGTRPLGSCCATVASAVARRLPPPRAPHHVTPSPAPRHPPEAPGSCSSEARMFFTSNLRSWALGGLGGQGS